jgi:hypothetical protein
MVKYLNWYELKGPFGEILVLTLANYLLMSESLSVESSSLLVLIAGPQRFLFVAKMNRSI